MFTVFYRAVARKSTVCPKVLSDIGRSVASKWTLGDDFGRSFESLLRVMNQIREFDRKWPVVEYCNG